MKVLCKLESYLLPLTTLLSFHQLFPHSARHSIQPFTTKGQKADACSPKHISSLREGLSEDPEGVWTSPPPPLAARLRTLRSSASIWRWNCSLSDSGDGQIFVCCLTLGCFFYHSGYSFRIKDQRPRLLSQEPGSNAGSTNDWRGDWEKNK